MTQAASDRVGISADGLVTPARLCPSPNQDPRPEGCEPQLIVVHGISLPPGEYGGPYVEQLFCNCLNPGAHPYFREIAGLTVSAHALVRRNGELLQFVSFAERAWHAGESSFRGRHRCNDYSIGIELEGQDDEPYEQAQYQSLAALIRALLDNYPGLSRRRIAGHADIAPGRKTDPGPAFDWMRLYDLLSDDA